MKKLVLFITLSIFLLISLGLPKKVLADDDINKSTSCPQGISGQFFDAKTKEPVGNVGFGINETYWDTAYQKETNKSMWTAKSDSQGKFSYSALEGYSIILTIGGKSGYIVKTVKISADNCLNNIINLEPKVSDDKDMCGKPCNGPDDNTTCKGATDDCTSCGVKEVNIVKTFYWCMQPSIREEGEKITPNSAVCISNPKCEACVKAGNAWTALGCLKTNNPKDFIAQILQILFAIGGGIAFILMIIGGLQIVLSGGNPEKVKAGKEIITAAVVGLILIIFSIFILKFISVDLLNLPGFSDSGGASGGF